MFNHPTWLRDFKTWGTAILAVPLLVITALLLSGQSRAAEQGFHIQVSPSPLVVTLNPGQTHTAVLTVRNLGTEEVKLIPSLSGVKNGTQYENIELVPEVPLGLDNWIYFKQSSLAIAPGQSQPLEIIYNTPAEAGFSYALAITLSSANKPVAEQGTTIEAQVAVFNLININRPDAKRELAIESFTSQKSRYEFLPAGFNLTVKNTGNVIDQPTGMLFIQRSFDDKDPIAALPLNQASGYILPDTTRSFETTWDEGFPSYQTSNKAGAEERKLRWDFRELGNLRMGKYVAKVVLVYNDGQRDVPVVASATFWVIPWRIIITLLVIGGLLATGLVVWGKAAFKGTKKVGKYAARR